MKNNFPYIDLETLFFKEDVILSKMKEELDKALIEKQEKEREFGDCNDEYSRIYTELKRKYQKKYKYLFKLRDIIYSIIIKPITFCIPVILAGLIIGIGIAGFNGISKILESFLIDISYELYSIAFGILIAFDMAFSALLAGITFKKRNRSVKEWRRNLYKSITKKINEYIEQKNLKLNEYQKDHARLVQKGAVLSVSKKERDRANEVYEQMKAMHDEQEGNVRYLERLINPTAIGSSISRRLIPYYYPNDNKK